MFWLMGRNGTTAGDQRSDNPLESESSGRKKNRRSGRIQQTLESLEGGTGSDPRPKVQEGGHGTLWKFTGRKSFEKFYIT